MKQQTTAPSYKQQQQQKKPDSSAPPAKTERIICDANIKPGVINVPIMHYLPSDNHIIMQLYDNPDTKLLQFGELKLEPAQFLQILHDINLKLLYVRSLQFTDFWCVMCDKEFKEFLDTFPLNFDPFLLDYLGHGKDTGSSRDLSNTINSILKSILLIYHRISFRTEVSKDNNTTYEMSPRAYAKTVYDGFLVDTAKLLDLCSIYGKSNGGLLSNTIWNIFENEPQYYEDLLEAVKVISTEFAKTFKDVQIALDRVSDMSDLNIQRLIRRLYDINDHVLSIASYFPDEGTDELFKVKAYLWLPIIREYTKKMARQITNPTPLLIRTVNSLIEGTVDTGVALANAGILLRLTSVKSDY